MNDRFYLIAANFWRGVCIGSIIGLGVAMYVTGTAKLGFFLRLALPFLVCLTIIPNLIMQFLSGLARYRATRKNKIG